MEEKFNDRFYKGKTVKLKLQRTDRSQIVAFKLICKQDYSKEWDFEFHPDDYTRLFKMLGTFELNVNLTDDSEYTQLLSIQDNNRHLKAINESLLNKMKELDKEIAQKNREKEKFCRDIESVLSYIKPALESFQLAPPKIEITNKHLKELEISVRLRNALQYNDILTTNDIIKYSAAELLKLRNFGRRCLEEIRKVLQRENLRLRGDW